MNTFITENKVIQQGKLYLLRRITFTSGTRFLWNMTGSGVTLIQGCIFPGIRLSISHLKGICPRHYNVQIIIADSQSKRLDP